MTETEYLLVCLAEEASEIIKDVSKALRFGLDDVAPNGNTNKQNLAMELTDLLAVYDLLEEDGTLKPFSYNPDLIAAKKAKVMYYMGMRQQPNLEEQ